MSTRCNIEFYDDYEHDGKVHQKLAARIYQHSDGYPHGVIPKLKKLEDFVSGDRAQRSMYGARTNDPEWCGAEFITMFRKPGYGNIYVSHQRHGDIAYLYKVYCHETGFHIDVYEAGNKRFKCVTHEFHPMTGIGIGQ